MDSADITPWWPSPSILEPEPLSVEARLEYLFRNPELLSLALRHESYANEVGDPSLSNERLEFLGDAVLGLVICHNLYSQFPQASEGRLAQMKSHLVSTPQLAKQARSLDLRESLSLGRGEAAQAGERNSLLADAFEAVVGAIYLDGGFDAAQGFILKNMSEALELAGDLRGDHKSVLQETTQRDYRRLPEYVVILEEGPSHQKVFEVEVRLEQEPLGRGTGRSKREASQRAAEQALRILSDPEIVERLQSQA